MSKVARPVLAIAAQIPSAELGAGYFQENPSRNFVQGVQSLLRAGPGANQMPAFGDRNPASRGQSRRLGRGTPRRHRASARRGRAAAETSRSAPQPSVAMPTRADVDRLAALLNSDGRVTILCGSGCQGAHDEVLALADRVKAPIVHAFRARTCRVGTTRFDVGMTGLIGSRRATTPADCDILLMLGTDFPYRQFYPRGAGVRIAQVDMRPEQMAAARRSISAWSATFARLLKTVLPLISKERDRTHLARATDITVRRARISMG